MTLRVLHIISGLDPRAGGPVNALEGLTGALVNTGVTVEVIAPYRAGDDPVVADRLADRGITVTRIGPVRTPLAWHPKLKPTVRAAVARADVVHIHGLWEDVQHHAARAAQALAKPYIIRPCGMLDPWSLNQSWLRKRIYMALHLRRNLNRAAALHFTAEAERELTEPLGLKPPAIIEPNGLDLSEFEHLPLPGTFRAACPALGDRPYVLFLSRIHHKKGLELLIPAFAEAAPPQYALVVAGPGEPGYINKIKALAAEHGLIDGERLIMPGMLTGQTKLAAYAEAELFALPSYQENFGIVIIEALACGTPVLISDQVNIHREISMAGIGVVAPPILEALIAILPEAIEDRGQYKATPNTAKHFVANHYDWFRIANAWLDHYRNLNTNTPDECRT